MATSTYKFRFARDSQNWDFNNLSAEPLVKGIWRYVGRHGTRPNIPSNLGYNYKIKGSLVSSVGSDFSTGAVNPSNCYWYVNFTIKDLFQIPANAIINSVNLFYTFRMIAGAKRNSYQTTFSRKTSALIMGEGEAVSGPAELFDSSGVTKIGQFSNIVENPLRGNGSDFWNKWPYTGNNENPIPEIPDCWYQVLGTPITLTGANQNPSTELQFRLNSVLPPTPPNNSLGLDDWYFFSIHMSNVWITIDYDVPSVTTSEYNLLERR